MADSRSLELVLTLRDQLSGGLKGAAANLKTLEPEFKKVALIGSASFAAVAAGIVFSTKAAMEAEAVQNRLAHILRTSRGASDEQINSLLNQADALEKLGVVSQSNILIAQSQLATFDLSSEAIERLTPSILDYAVAEKGAAVSADELKQMTNGLAQALGGNFTSLTKTGFVLDDVTKDLIENGTEAERTAALVKVLESTYKGFNAAARETAEGRLKVLNNEFGRLQEEVGKALLPAMTQLLQIVTPLISKIANFASENRELTTAIVAIAGVSTGLVATLGVLGLAIPAITAGVAALGATIGTALPWIGLLSVALGATAYVIGKINSTIGEEIAMHEAAAAEANKQADAMIAARKPVEDLAVATKKLSKEAEESAKKLSDLRKEALLVIADFNQDEMSGKKNMAEELIAQEQKVADMKAEIAEMGTQLTTEEAVKEYRAKQEQLAIEEEALRNAGFIRMTLATEVAEAERRASLTTFERRLEDIQKERIANLQKHIGRLQEINQEIAAEQLKNKEIVKSYSAAQVEMQEATKATTFVIQAEANKQLSALRSVASFSSGLSIGGLSTPSYIAPRAAGGPVTAGSPYLVGEKGPELFVPGQSGSIIPNGSGGNVVVNVYGDVSGNELVERVQESIMNMLRLNHKFAI
jgi:hypothetical protein